MPTDDLTPEERLRLQNELTRADLEENFGAVFGFGDEADASEFSPEMEADFLRRIQEIEGGGPETYIPIRDFLSLEAEQKASRLAATGNFEEATDVLLDHLISQGVGTLKPEWLSPEGFYHFITQDLVKHTIPQPPAFTKGMEQDETLKQMVFVTYDQVRPDSPDNMAVVTEQMLEDLLDMKNPFNGTVLSHTCRQGAKVVSKETAITTIRRWKEQWTQIEAIGYQPINPLVAPDGALYFQFNCAYNVVDKKGNREEYEGSGLCQLAQEDKALRVVGFVMEGFEM